MRGLLAVVMLTVLASCSSGSPSAVAPATDAPTTSTSNPDLGLTVTMVHHSMPSDGSGIGRVNDDEGGACGVSGFTRRTDTMAGWKVGAQVTFRDEKNTLVGTAALPAGVSTGVNQAGANRFDCTWTVTTTIKGSPEFLAIAVADDHIVDVKRSDFASGSVAITVS